MPLKRHTPDLTLVLPAYQEEVRIGSTLDELAVFLASDRFFRRKQVEVLVVVADTTDRTTDIVIAKRELFTSLVLLRPGARVGKGRDVQYGMLRAQGKCVIYMDADLATPLSHLEQFYKLCEQGCEVVIGTRNLSTYRSSWIRNLLARLGNILYRTAGGVQVEDTQCGFKMFSQRATQLCFKRLTILGWGFDQEVLAIADVNGLSIRSVQIDDWVDKPFSTYTDHILRITLRSVHDFIQIKLNLIRGRYSDGRN